jgi:hypothetical protein
MMTVRYLQFGFTYVGDSSTPDAQRVLCYQTLGSSSMVNAELQLYLHTKHVDCKDKPIAFLNVNVMSSNILKLI